jgi:hypothetical protein
VKTLSLLVATLLLTTMLSAGNAPGNAGNDAAAAFARLKTLAGEWGANVDGKKSHLTYEVIAGGSSIVEHESVQDMPEMLTVYYLDGNRLLLTHYCAAGNQPRLEAKSFDPQTGELRFQFLDATNLTSANAGHMHNVTLRLLDNNHLSSEWQFFENGQQKFTEKAQYTRTR